MRYVCIAVSKRTSKKSKIPIASSSHCSDEIEQKLLAVPWDQRVFLAESLLSSVPLTGKEMTEEEEMAKVERREREIETGQVRALADAEFWREAEVI